MYEVREGGGGSHNQGELLHRVTTTRPVKTFGFGGWEVWQPRTKTFTHSQIRPDGTRVLLSL